MEQAIANGTGRFYLLGMDTGELTLIPRHIDPVADTLSREDHLGRKFAQSLTLRRRPATLAFKEDSDKDGETANVGSTGRFEDAQDDNEPVDAESRNFDRLATLRRELQAHRPGHRTGGFQGSFNSKTKPDPFHGPSDVQWRHALLSDGVTTSAEWINHGYTADTLVLDEDNVWTSPPDWAAMRSPQPLAMMGFSVDSGADITWGPNEDAQTALQRAMIHIWSGSIWEIVDLLQRLGPDPNSSNQHRDPSLFEACDSFEELMDLLLGREANPNASARREDQLLISSVKFGNRAAVRLLLGVEADPDAPASDHTTLLTAVSEPKDETMPRTSDISPGWAARHLLENAATLDNTSIIHALVKHFILGGDSYGTLEDAALSFNSKASLPFLLQSGADYADLTKCSLSRLPDRIEAQLLAWNAAKRYADHKRMRSKVLNARGGSPFLHISSYVWNWKVPALVQIAKSLGISDAAMASWILHHNVIVFHYYFRRDTTNGRLYATTYLEYAGRRWGDRLRQKLLNFVSKLLDEVVSANLSPENDGTFKPSLTGYRTNMNSIHKLVSQTRIS